MAAYLYVVIPYNGEPHPYDKSDKFEIDAFIPELYGLDSDLCNSITLYYGFFVINTCYRMPSIMTNRDGYCGLRANIYKIAKRVGASEVWYCSESAVDELEDYDNKYTLDRFKNHISSEYADDFLEYDKDTMRERGGTYASCMRDDFHDIVLY